MRVDRTHTNAMHASQGQSAMLSAVMNRPAGDFIHKLLHRAVYTALFGSAAVCLLAGASAWADTHTAGNLQELQQAIKDANGDTNPPVVIQLDSDITIPDSTTLATITRNLTLDANGHTLNGTSGSSAHRDGGHISLVTDSGAALTVKGNFHGGAGAGGNGGDGGDGGNSGDSGHDGGDGHSGGNGSAGGGGGIGLSLNSNHFTNKATINGGDGGDGGSGGDGGDGGDGGNGSNGGRGGSGGDGGTGGTGLIFNGTTFTNANTGLITGGNGGDAGANGAYGRPGMPSPATGGGGGGGAIPGGPIDYPPNPDPAEPPGHANSNGLYAPAYTTNGANSTNGAGGAGGTGVFFDGDTLNNDGHISGGEGGFGASGSNGKDGNNAADGSALGGDGSDAANGSAGSMGGAGGAGGVGVQFNGKALTNTGGIAGGDGGFGGGGGDGGNGGAGGDGGQGISGASGGAGGGLGKSAGNGGDGGDGGHGGDAGNGGDGGAGGTGVVFAGQTLTNEGAIVGGLGADGGDGGNAGAGGSYGSGGAGGTGGLGGSGAPGARGRAGDNGKAGAGGDGGVGGTGIEFFGTTLINDGDVIGGDGGNGGYAGVAGSPPDGGFGGDGGDGIAFTSGGTLINTADIAGGDGGLGSNSDGGAGGNGVTGADVTIINSGTIAGGDGGNNAADGDAVEFTGGTNRLELREGSGISGHVDASAGADDTLAFGGDTEPSNIGWNQFSMGNVGSNEQYRGFEHFEKTGDSTWLLTGSTNQQADWTLKQGKLTIESDGALGAQSNDLTFDGGTLENMVAMTSARDIHLQSGGGTIETPDDLTLSGDIDGGGSLTKTGNGILTLTGSNSYTGDTTINAGTLVGNTVSLQGDITNNAQVVFDQTSDGGYTGSMTGSGSLTKQGSGTLTLTGASTYSGGTTVSDGTLVGDTDSLQGDITNNTTLVFDQTRDDGYTGVMSGSGSLTKQGSGTLALTGDSAAFGGDTIVSGGTLVVDNALGGTAAVQSGATLLVGGDNGHANAQFEGNVTVQDKGTLGGHGTVADDVNVATGGHIAPGNSIGTLTIGGDLTAAQGSQFDYEFGALGSDFDIFGSSDSIVVHGDLALNGAKLNVDDTGNMGPGLYNLFSYDGSLSNDQLQLGATPSGLDAQDLELQFLNGDGQINLLNKSGLTINFWNANGQADANHAGGGDGIWSNDTANWADADGQLTRPMQPQPGFAIFAGDSGEVTVDNGDGNVEAIGLQFVVDGYHLSGDTLTLVTDGSGDAPVIRVGDGSANSGAMTATMDNVLAGHDGWVKADTGTLVLDGDSSALTGTTAVNGGRLIIGGTAGSSALLGGDVTIASGSTLGGHGAIGGKVQVKSGATVAPGHSIGTLTVGTLSTDSGSVFAVDVNASGDHDTLQVTGAATLNGGDVQVNAADGDYAASIDYTILTADGGVTGEFDDVSTNLAFLDPSLSYDPHDVLLTLKRNDADFSDVADSPNQDAVADGVQDAGPGDPIHDSIVQLDGDDARDAFDALSGEYYASRTSALLRDSHYLRDAVSDRLQIGCAHDGDKATAARRKACAGDVWLQAYGDWGHFDGSDAGGARLNHDSSGFFIGADRETQSGLRLGFVAGYSHGKSDVDARASSGSSDTYQLGLYAGWQHGAWQFKTGVAHAWYDLSNKRTVTYPGLHDRLSADYHGQATQVFAEGGHAFDFDAVTIEPFLRGAWVHLSTDGFTERGGAAALSAERQSHSLGLTLAGTRLASAFAVGEHSTLQLRGLLGWRHAYGDRTPQATLSLTGGSGFTVSGVAMARDALVVQAGLGADVGQSWTFGFDYVGEYGSGIISNGIQANATWRF